MDVTISLSDADRAYFGAHYPNGGYVDGYLYVNAEDGTGKQMSIPLLAYYGNWTEPSMYDKYDFAGGRVRRDGLRLCL